MASPYLSTRTASLESSSPVPPQQARAAQIPLQSFSLPVFPPEAFTTSTSAPSLDALILTSDIKMDEYSTLLTQPFSIPDLPKGIKSLTLEMFALGYPAGFLLELGRQLGNGVGSLTVFEQLFGGTVPRSKEDAVAFIKAQEQLKEVHFLDVFAPRGFWSETAGALSNDVKFLEIGATYRHADPAFESTLPQGGELAAFVKKGLVGVRFAMGAPIVTGDEEEGTEVGINPVGITDKGGRDVVKALVEEGGDLMLCDLTMFEVSVEEVDRVLDACGKLRVAAFSVGIDDGWAEVLEKLGGKKEKERNVEILEIVSVPGEDWVERIKNGGETGLITEALGKLGETWKELKSVKVSLLRTKGEEWTKEGDVWAKK